MSDQCPVCFHTNFNNPAIDDMEAQCGCNCHEEREETFDDESSYGNDE